jgi:hypothetical protein
MTEPPIYSVTSARRSLSDDQADRNRKYLISMSIRIVCFIGCILADGWLRWILFVGALVLPWLAVVIANAGREQRGRATSSVVPKPNELQ